MPMHVRKGDKVIVTAGDHKGKTGEVMRVDPKGERVFVKGVNLRTRHMKPTQRNPQGGIITREAALHISNVSPMAGGRATRVRFEVKADGSKSRIAVRDGSVLGKIRGSRKASAAKPAAAGSGKMSRAQRKAARAAQAGA